jgi:hypothetical protein
VEVDVQLPGRPDQSFLVDVTGLFTLHNAPQWLGGTALTLRSRSWNWWGLGYPHHLLSRRPGHHPQGSAGRRPHRRRQRMAGLLASSARASRLMMILVVLRFGTAMAVIDA